MDRQAPAASVVALRATISQEPVNQGVRGVGSPSLLEGPKQMQMRSPSNSKDTTQFDGQGPAAVAGGAIASVVCCAA